MYVAFKANAMNLKFIILVFQFKLTITDQVQVIRTVFEDDPVTKEYLDTGWKIVDYQTDCAQRIEDLELCEKCDLMENTSWDKTLHLLSHCRRKCQEEFHNSSEQLPEIVEHLGGLEDFLEQPFGFSLPVCSLREGYSKSQVLSGQIFTKFLEEVTKFVPAFTEKGFMKSRIPKQLFKTILEARILALKETRISVEKVVDDGILNGWTMIENQDSRETKLVHVHRTQMIDLDEATREEMFKTLGPLAEQWSNLKLAPTSIYGIRRYRNMSTLLAHVDQLQTHVISIIINVAQDVDEKWPLYIKDNDGGEKKIFLEPGEMLFYESARLVHGRQLPLRGSFYDNVFIHYKPRGLWYERQVLPDHPQLKISSEAVRWSQRHMKTTDWSQSWRNFLMTEMNKDLRSLGYDNVLTTDDEGPDDVFVHIHPK